MKIYEFVQSPSLWRIRGEMEWEGKVVLGTGVKGTGKVWAKEEKRGKRWMSGKVEKRRGEDTLRVDLFLPLFFHHLFLGTFAPLFLPIWLLITLTFILTHTRTHTHILSLLLQEASSFPPYITNITTTLQSLLSARRFFPFPLVTRPLFHLSRKHIIGTRHHFPHSPPLANVDAGGMGMRGGNRGVARVKR